MINKEEVKQLIEANLEGSTAIVRNEYDDGEHFDAEVVCAAFEGKTLIAQHRLVYGALGDAMHKRIHALQLKTYTPARWPH